MITIKTIVIGTNKMNTEQMRKAIEEVVQDMANQGWTLRAHGSRGGAMYATFAKKEKGHV
jgi:hypothetical protein